MSNPEHCSQCGQRLKKPGALLIRLGILTIPAAVTIGLAVVAVKSGISAASALLTNRQRLIAAGLSRARDEINMPVRMARSNEAPDKLDLAFIAKIRSAPLACLDALSANLPRLSRALTNGEQ